MASLLLYPHMAENRESYVLCHVKKLILSWGFYPYDLITSWRPHFLVPSHWRLEFQWVLGRHKPSVYDKSFQPNLILALAPLLPLLEVYGAAIFIGHSTQYRKLGSFFPHCLFMILLIFDFPSAFWLSKIVTVIISISPLLVGLHL